MDRDALKKGQGHELEAVQPLTAALSKLSIEDIESFAEQLAKALYDLDGLQYYRAASDSQSDDGFLYARCFVVGSGKTHYEEVLSDPSKMPKDLSWFESILTAAPAAWAQITGQDESDWSYQTKLCYETGSNAEGWPD